MAESRWTRSMLLDFYGELLTDKQRECFDLHYNEDLSLSEIADQLGISRQGVWDNIRRAEASMKEIEEKTGLIRRFEGTKRTLEAIKKQAEQIGEMTEGSAKGLAQEIVREIDSLED